MKLNTRGSGGRYGIPGARHYCARPVVQASISKPLPKAGHWRINNRQNQGLVRRATGNT
jgi:hypothetical protein